MTYKVRFSAQARRDIQGLFDYLAGFSPDAAQSYVSELELAIERHLATRPLSWQFFFLTGAPFRAYLFKLSRRNAYWVVYQVNEEQDAVEILRIWHSAQDPEEFDLR